MNNEWFTTKDLIKFDGLPSTEPGIRKKADTEAWESRPRTKGKGLEYHIDSLPAKARTAIKISQAKKAASSVTIINDDSARQLRKEQSLERYRQLSDSLKRTIDAKLEILEAAKAFHTASGLSKGAAYTEFAKAYKADDITVEPWVREVQPACSRPRLYEWEKALKEHGIDALAGDRGKGRRATGAIDTQPALREYIIGMIVAQPHIKMSVLFKAMNAEFAGTDINLVSLRSLERWVDKWKQDNAQVFCAVTSPDKWKNKYMAAMGSASEHVIALNQLWEFDSTPADLMLTDGRHSILGVIDVYSRRTIFVVMPTSDSKGVAKVIRRAILEWGVPQVAKTDNGADYKSKWIKHVFKALDIEQEFCPPFQGWKKPHIERVFKTFSHDVAELLPGFIGHNVSERQLIESRKSFSDRLFKKDQLIEVKMSSAELQQFCNDWLAHEYHSREHASLKCSPNEQVASWAGAIRTVSNERLLDVLLSEPAGTRTIRKDGISLNGGTYIHAELAAHMGESVSVFYDETDMGRIYVYNSNGEFLCTAEDPSITGVSRTEVAAKAKDVQREAVQEERRRLKAASRKVTKRDVAQQILEHRAAEERAEKVRHFPRPQVEHGSAGLSAAADALNANQNQLPSWFDKDQPIDTEPATKSTAAPTLAHVVKPLFNKGESNRGLTVPDDLAERYQFWENTIEKIQEGTATEEETKWAKTFKGSLKWSTGKMLQEMRQEASGQ